MSKVAAAANNAGVDIDQLNAILATVISVTREAPETIGSAFKTIFARLGDLALNGEDEYGVSLGKVSGQLHELGIEILDQKGEMRDMGDIIEDTAAKWQTWTRAQKQAAAVAMGGKMQYSRLIALFDSFDKYKQYLNDSVTAMGTLNEQQDIYMDSTRAHLQQLTTETEKTYDILFDTDSVNNMADAATGLMGILNSGLTGLGGGLQTLIALATNLANIFSKQIGAGINNVVQNLQIKRNNLSAEQLKGQLASSIASDYKVQGENISSDSAKVQAEAEVAQKILGIKQALTQEEYEQLTAAQKRLGASAELISSLQEYKKIGLELLGDAEATSREYKERLTILQNELDTQKRLNAEKKNELKSSIGKYNADERKDGRTTNIKNLKKDLQNLEGSLTTHGGDRKNIQSAINKLTNKEKITQEEISSILKAQNDTLNQKLKEEERLKQGLQEREQLEEGQDSQQNDQDLVNEIEKQKQRQILIQESIAGFTSLASTIILVNGAVKTLFNEDLS